MKQDKPTPLLEQPPRRSSRVALIVVAALLVAGVLLGSFVLRRQSSSIVGPGTRSAVPGVAFQKQGDVIIYSVTLQGGPRPQMTPQVNLSGSMILTPPVPAFFQAGNIYRNSYVYRADTGLPVQQYLKELGDVGIYQPRLVDGILYMAVRTPDFSQGPGKMVMYALRASDGTVLWKWGDCGESVNMSSPSIMNGMVSFVCESAPAVYRLYALRASNGSRLWLDTFNGEISLNPIGDQRALYIQLGDQLLAENADTGTLFGKQRFGSKGYSIDQLALAHGIIYMVKEKVFYALKTSDGRPLWEYQFTGDEYYLHAIVAQNEIYLIVNEWRGPFSIYALDGMTGVLHWQRQINDANDNFPIVDQGNLYLVNNVFASPKQPYAQPLKRTLIAIQGSDGRTLWQQDIPWNKGKLEYAMIEAPMLSAGGGGVYLVDWARTGYDPQNLQATLGAFSERSGTLLWTRDVA